MIDRLARDFEVPGARDRAQLEATYYNRTIRDFLLQPSVAPSTGLGVLAVNAGRFRTAGGELGLTTVPVQNRTLTWTSRATWQTCDTRINALPNFVAPFAVVNSFGASFGRNRVQPGQSATSSHTVEVYDLSNLSQVSHSGTLDVTADVEIVEPVLQIAKTPSATVARYMLMENRK